MFSVHHVTPRGPPSNTACQNQQMSAGVWTLLVPLKPAALAKSRLRGALPGVPHEELVESLAAATIEAASASPLVGELIVVTGGPDLNTALRNAFRAGPLAVLPADLPALRTAELTEALELCAVRSFVPDAEGTGTVLLAAPRGDLDPRFGVGSALAHERSGARRLDGDWPTLRRDVDTAADLAAAQALGWTHAGHRLHLRPGHPDGFVVAR
jgi:2-phospho-L-lactate/phosphoenolpyruvate guanylyltransferase